MNVRSTVAANLNRAWHHFDDKHWIAAAILRFFSGALPRQPENAEVTWSDTLVAAYKE
jgi:hypothetical protein